MRGKIHSFGCSFSTRTHLPKEMFWLYKLAKFYGVKYDAWGTGASEYHEAFHRLTAELPSYKEGDLIIFQFTDHSRIGVRHPSTNKYFTTATLPTNVEDFEQGALKYLQLGKFTQTYEDIAQLYEYANKWSETQMYWHYWRVWNVLSYLKAEKNVDFILLFLNDRWAEVIPDEHYSNIPIFNVSGIRNNLSMGKYVWQNKLSLGQDNRYANTDWWNSTDGHPSDTGHSMIAQRIILHIFSKWDETSPWCNI